MSMTVATSAQDALADAQRHLTQVRRERTDAEQIARDALAAGDSGAMIAARKRTENLRDAIRAAEVTVARAEIAAAEEAVANADNERADLDTLANDAQSERERHAAALEAATTRLNLILFEIGIAEINKQTARQILATSRQRYAALLAASDG
jgi:hypothetical protein